ncbi:MAG: DUF2922 domain-containing protein [Clostridium sp.]
MEKDLVMTFITEEGSKSNVTLKNVKDGVTSEEVSALMDSIIGKNILISSKGDLIKKSSAKLVETTKTEYLLN